MRTNILLIILGFIQFIFCSDQINSTDYDSYPVCPVSFRRKRALSLDYTRWRANLETTQEFIVKVLDEDITTPNTKQIVAVNIHPVTKAGEKIIVGGARVPPPTSTSPALDQPREYTRFVPPTTVAETRIEGELFLAPASNVAASDNMSPIKLKTGLVKDKTSLIKDIVPIVSETPSSNPRHSQRDESPPASPQFVARTPLFLARQYAPIAPVAFTLKTTIAPLKPSVVDSHITHKTNKSPTRTEPNDVTLPTRTKSYPEDSHSYEPFFEDEVTLKDAFLRRTSYMENNYELQRTTQWDWDFRKKMIKERTTKHEETKKSSEKDADLSYNMMFYNEEDNEIVDKKGEHEIDENNDDKNKGHDTVTEKDSEDKDINPLDLITEAENSTDTEVNVYPEDDESENITTKIVTKDDSVVPKIEIITPRTMKDKIKDSRQPICNLLKLRQLNFNSPRTLPEIVAQLKQWAEESPVAKWVDITDGNLTTMENPIYMMIVDDPSSGQIISAKQTVMVIAGIQGRDHHAVAAAMYVLYQLIERSEAHADLLTKYRFWIIPVFNPDGYDYSMTFPHRREWSKNLRQNWDECKGRESCHVCESFGLRCIIQPCYGVNLDRNFEYQWIPTDELRSEHPCGDLYAGARQLSEPETRALTHYLHEQKTPLYTFIAFKEGDVLGIMYPYSHTRKRRAFDHVYRQRASRAASAAYAISGRPYVAGQTSEFLPLYAGGIEDWVDGHLGIDNTYTIMMFRPTDSYNLKLITERVVHEAYAAMDTLLLQSVEPFGPPQVTITKARGAETSHTSSALILLTVVHIFLST